MTNRTLYIVAYDVASPRRLRKLLNIVKEFATGGQKSVFECFLTKAEHASLLNKIKTVINVNEDKVFVLRMDPRCRVDTIGIAESPTDSLFFYQG